MLYSSKRSLATSRQALYGRLLQHQACGMVYSCETGETRCRKMHCGETTCRKTHCVDVSHSDCLCCSSSWLAICARQCREAKLCIRLALPFVGLSNSTFMNYLHLFVGSHLRH